MKICIDARVIINKNTGIGIYTYNLIKGLLEIDSVNEYHVIVNENLKSDHPIHKLTNSNFIKHIVNIREVSVKQQFLIPIMLQKINPDIYHYPNFDIPVFHQYKSVFTVHDLTYIKHKSLYIGSRWIKNQYTKLIMLMGAMKARKIISVSKSTKQDLIDILNIPSDKIKVIYEAISNNLHNGKMKNNNLEFLSDYNLKDKVKKYFFFMGERRPHKNIVRLIEAFALFKSQYSSNHKLIIGGKPYKDYHAPELKVKELELENDVKFVGYIAEKDIQNFYSNAECFLLPSIYEGFGIPIIEAMTCGVPVITSNLSSMPEIANGSAITINPYESQEIANALFSIVTEPKLKKQLIDKGIKRAKEFNWKKTAKETLEVYEKILHNS